MPRGVGSTGHDALAEAPAAGQPRRPAWPPASASGARMTAAAARAGGGDELAAGLHAGPLLGAETTGRRHAIRMPGGRALRPVTAAGAASPRRPRDPTATGRRMRSCRLVADDVRAARPAARPAEDVVDVAAAASRPSLSTVSFCPDVAGARVERVHEARRRRRLGTPARRRTRRAGRVFRSPTRIIGLLAAASGPADELAAWASARIGAPKASRCVLTKRNDRVAAGGRRSAVQPRREVTVWPWIGTAEVRRVVAA